jgi:glycosyltransferase involved in cell wall biosynthesis
MTQGRAHVFVVPWKVTDGGGVNQVVLNLYRQFEAGGVYTPRIFVTSWDCVRPSRSTEQGRSVTRMRLRPPYTPHAPFGSLAKWTINLIPELSRLARYLRANDVSNVNVHYPSLAALQFVLARYLFKRELKIILSFHGLELVHACGTAGLERWLWRFLLRRADAVVSCSNAQKTLILCLEPNIAPRVTTIHNGVDIDNLMLARNPDARIDPRLQGRPFILSVASYEHKKGLDTLLQAFRAVRTSHGGVMLAIVGPDRGMGDELRQIANQMSLTDDVVFCGELPHADLHAYYETAKVFCLPSRSEPFGIVLLEAGAFRCPVVATSVGGIPEILADQVNACLVPPEDPVALAGQLQRLLGDGKERDRLSSALFEHVRAHFPWKQAYGSYMKLCTHD